MAQQLDGLKLSGDSAEAIIEKAIEHGAYDSDMPGSTKEKLAAAEEIIAFAVDAWINDNIRPDDDDPEVAASGQQLQDLMDLAGVEVDEDGSISYGEPVASEDDEDEDEDADDAEEDEEDDEEPFNPDDYINGYTELSVVSKLKKLKELDVNSDDDAAVLEAVADWENEQDKPNSRVLNYIDEVLGEEEEEEQPEQEAPEAEADSDEEEAEEDDEPWDGYNKATATEIKQVLREQADDEDEPLTAEQVEYVLEYEQAREKPPTRKRIIEFCNALLEKIAQRDNGDDSEPAPKAKPEKPVKPAKVKAENGVITLTREQILTALESGKVEIEVA